MNPKFTNLVQAFLNGDLSAFHGDVYFNLTSTEILFNNEKFIEKTKKGLFIERKFISSGDTMLVDLLKHFDGISAVLKADKCFINGILWDGTKTNLELFI
jgi:hypothetical protein